MSKSKSRHSDIECKMHTEQPYAAVLSPTERTTVVRKIVLTTLGTLGDLHPFIALALALRTRGFTPVLAVPQDQVDKCIRSDLRAVATQPGLETIPQRMNLKPDAAIQRIMGNQRIMLEQVVLPGIEECARNLDAVAADAEAIVASIFVVAAPMIAEKRAIPLMSVVLQPMGMLSVYDAPRTRDFWMMMTAPVGRAAAAWNRFCFGGMRQVLDWRYRRRIDTVRLEHGLRPTGASRMLQTPLDALLRLGFYSPQLASRPSDASDATQVVGFPFFDGAGGRHEALDPVLAKFLEAGPPPLVFTLGTLAVNSAGRFYDLAAEAARRLGLRAVLLVGGVSAPVVDCDNIWCGYVPHSLLFAKATAIIHHGGIGTTGQALRSGKPQLIVPHMGDQHDHADRIVRMGVGLRLRADRFTAERATRLLSTLLATPSYRTVAKHIAETVQKEHGAEAAADAIVAALDSLNRKARV